MCWRHWSALNWIAASLITDVSVCRDTWERRRSSCRAQASSQRRDESEGGVLRSPGITFITLSYTEREHNMPTHTVRLKWPTHVYCKHNRVFDPIAASSQCLWLTLNKECGSLLVYKRAYAHHTSKLQLYAAIWLLQLNVVTLYFSSNTTLKTLKILFFVRLHFIVRVHMRRRPLSFERARVWKWFSAHHLFTPRIAGHHLFH